jgi:stress response protein YsnF
MKYTKLFRQSSLACAGAAALTLLSGCQTHQKKPVAYYSNGAYMGGSSSGTSTQYGTSSSSASGDYQATASQDQSAPAQAQQANQAVIPLHQETLRVGTREVDGGAVRIRKIIRTETVSQPVQVRRETVVVDRVQGDAAAQAGQQAGQPAGSNLAQQGGVTTPFQEGEMIIRLKREEPVVETQTVPAGSIVAQTRINTDQVNVQKQVRREDVEVIKEGNPQNVTISDKLQGSPSREAAGAGPSLGGTAQGAESGQPITDLSQLTGQGDRSALAGKTIRFSSAKVQSVSSDHTLFALGNDQSSKIWAHTSQPVQDVKEGDTVKVNGVVQTLAQSQASFTEETSQQLKSEPIYIQATTIQKVNQ